MSKIFLFLSVLCLNTLFSEELTLQNASQIMDGAIEKAQQLNIKIAVAVVDRHGNLKAFMRMDDSPLICAKSAEMKAFTSASGPFSTKQIAEMSATDPNHAFANLPGFLLLQGGLPIFSTSGAHIGGIGIGGGSGEQDEECAQAGLKALVQP